MKLVRTNLLGAAALAIVLGFSVAQAQTPGTDMAPGNAGGPQLNKGGPVGGLMNDGGPSLGAPKGGVNAGADVGAETSDDGALGKGAGKAGKSAEGGTGMTTDGKAGKSAKGDTDTTTDGKAEGQVEMKGKAGATAEGQTKAEGKAGTHTKLGAQEVSKVRGYFHTHKPSARRVETSQISVSIGIAIPAAIGLYDLPPDIIVVEGGCPIKYFVWGDDVVLVDSCTRHVVEIIVDVA